MSKPLRVWDSNTLNVVQESCLQILAKLEEQCVSAQLPPEELPNSILPTELLYNLCVCLTYTYDKLLAADLISAGYPKSSKLTH